MDPEACVRRILSACGQGGTHVDIEKFTEACEDLAEWLTRGGFAPTNIGEIQTSMLLLLRMHNPGAALVLHKAQK